MIDDAYHAGRSAGLAASVRRAGLKRLIPFCTVFVLFVFGCLLYKKLTAIEEGERIARLIMREALISFKFEPVVHDICNKYVGYTDFDGRININRPYTPDHLNVYIFNYSDRLPAYLRNNCTAFPRSHVIICDHDLLDSIPAAAPLILQQDQRSSFHPS